MREDTVTIPGVPPSEQLIERIGNLSGGKVLLAFSTGKDAIASWLALRNAGLKVYPFYMYGVPNLGFVERSLEYYEEFFQTRIIRVPHHSLYRKLNACVFTPPQRLRIIENWSLPTFTHHELYDALKHDLELPENTFTAVGVRAADSPKRRISIAKTGPANYNVRQFYPVWDWKLARLVHELQQAKVKLPVDYRLFSRSFDGIDYRFMQPIKEHFPEDYAKIIEWFPLAELELFRATLSN